MQMEVLEKRWKSVIQPPLAETASRRSGMV
jgi:hypothetical protein